MGNPKQNVFLHLTFTMNQYIDEPRYSCDEGRSKISLIASIGMDGTSVGNAPESITTDAVASETPPLMPQRLKKAWKLPWLTGSTMPTTMLRERKPTHHPKAKKTMQEPWLQRKRAPSTTTL